MSSRGKKKTTMAKLSRESKLRERRFEKEARKQARRYAAETALTSEQAPDVDESPDVDDSGSLDQAPLATTAEIRDQI
jgi:hypothetical protein